MSAGIVEEPGFDTKIQQFTPIRNSPVWRRAVRQYHCEEDVANTSDFTRLQFKVHCQEKNLVCGDARIVFPLELMAFYGDPDDLTRQSTPMSMAVNDGKASCNIAISQNAPWNAFETVNTVVNTKVYTEKPRSYGKMLSSTYQSVSELQFMNNHSLKPIANTARDPRLLITQQHPVLNHNGEPTGSSVTVHRSDNEPTAFSLENANSGFLERSRHFQDNLNDSGLSWEGDISSLLNCGPFSAEARGQGNDQIPFIEDLFLSLVFKQTKCSLDAGLAPSRGADYRKVIIQSLFEFLTPATASFFKKKAPPALQFPTHYILKWTSRPYIQIEWLSYNPAAMLPMYRLQGFQYKLTKSNEFFLPLTDRMDERNVFSPRVSTQCLSVPNKLYIWAELSENSARDSFLFGGAFRTCEIVNKTLMVRVNGESHIIDRPDNQSMLFKWWKRHSNSVAEYPTWQKCPVIILTPNEIGLSNWLENDAILSTVEVSCDIQLSKLQHIEYNTAISEDGLIQSGIRTSTHNAPELTYIPFRAENLSWRFSDNFSHTDELTHSGILSLHTITRSKNLLQSGDPPYIPATARQMGFMENYYIRNLNQDERMRVKNCLRGVCRLQNSVWVKYNTNTRNFVSTFFHVPLTHWFEFQNYVEDRPNNESEGFRFCPWDAVDTYDFESVPIIQTGDDGQRLDLSVFGTLGRTFDNHLQDPIAMFNYQNTMPGGDARDIYKGSSPGPDAVSLDKDGIYFSNNDSAEIRPYINDMMEVATTDKDAYTTIWGDSDGVTPIVWICMEPPEPETDEWYFFKEQFLNAQDEPIEVDRETALEAIYECSLYRGEQNSIIENTSFRSINQIVGYARGHEAKDTAQQHLKYELNILSEYSNQQIVMDANRRTAVRLENNVPVAF